MKYSTGLLRVQSTAHHRQSSLSSTSNCTSHLSIQSNMLQQYFTGPGLNLPRFTVLSSAAAANCDHLPPHVGPVNYRPRNEVQKPLHNQQHSSQSQTLLSPDQDDGLECVLFLCMGCIYGSRTFPPWACQPRTFPLRHFPRPDVSASHARNDACTNFHFNNQRSADVKSFKIPHMFSVHIYVPYERLRRVGWLQRRLQTMPTGLKPTSQS